MQANLSVIIPFFNDHKTIIRAIESVKNQTLKPKELIIIDDHSSTPLEKNKIEAALNGTNIVLIILRNKINKGASYSRNMGVNSSSCKYICFLDADDSWHPQKISIQYNLMLQRNVCFTFHKYSTLSKNYSFKKNHELKKINKTRFVFGNFICTPTVMCLKEKFITFDPKHLRMEDYKCWIENSIINDLFYIDMILAYGYKKPIGDSGLSGSVKLMHLSCIGVINSLKKEKKINWIFYVTATLIEQIKYPIRILKNLIP